MSHNLLHWILLINIKDNIILNVKNQNINIVKIANTKFLLSILIVTLKSCLTLGFKVVLLSPPLVPLLLILFPLLLILVPLVLSLVPLVLPLVSVEFLFSVELLVVSVSVELLLVELLVVFWSVELLLLVVSVFVVS